MARSALLSQAGTRLPGKRSGFSDVLMYVFTSGTTGLPKACRIKNSRYLLLGAGIPRACQLRPDDVLYTGLPMYHSAASGLAIGSTLIEGE